MGKVRSLKNLPKRKVTIEDILWRDDLDSAMQDTLDDMDGFTELLIIGTNQEGEICWRHSSMALSRLIYVMKVVENALLNKE